MMKLYGIALFLLIVAFSRSNLIADELPSLVDLVNKKGQLTLSDGSSNYVFKRDGSFRSSPLALCGRSIEGTWHASGEYRVSVEGRWGWVNGVSSANDIRSMSLIVYPLTPFKGGPAGYSWYIVIDELEKKSP